LSAASSPRFDRAALEEFSAAVFRAAGFGEEAAKVTANLLVEADAMGHDTHGMAQAPVYLQALADGFMIPDSAPDVIRDKGAVLTWDGRYQPGLWLIWSAIQAALGRVETYGTASVAIRRSHHIGCLAAFLPLITERGYMGLLYSSDPAIKAVAPFGSVEQIYTPNPIACGIPTQGDPILIDVSASGTTIGLSMRAIAAGQPLAGEWLVDADGNPSADPALLQQDPPGALLPLGGADRGHKGFGLGLMVEALTSGLGGFGRLQGPAHQGASVFLQVLDPDAFGGGDEFRAETQHLVDLCHGSKVPAGKPAVRLPGERGLALKRDAAANGVALHPTILPALLPWATQYGVTSPSPRG
jgi:LDH2 family malate/lactate/ureidoglycolate dehydrogenase